MLSIVVDNDSGRWQPVLPAGGEAAAFGGIALWSLPHDQFIAAKLMGLQLIDTKKAGHSCCHSTASAVDTSGSALLLGLRGHQPFDGSQFPRLPWGRPAMAESEIAEIADFFQARICDVVVIQTERK